MNVPANGMAEPAGGSLGEFGRIARFFRPLAAGYEGALGLGDDAALVKVPAGQELVVTTDAIVAGIHFLPADTPEDIARKALRVNLSDLAAKGARPMAYFLTLALGREIGDSWVERFAAALALDQVRFGIALAGGDSVSTNGPVWASITALGLVDPGRMVRRRGAQPGDLVFVTGTIGDAALGLAVAGGGVDCPAADAAYLVSRYRVPEPRCDLAAAIAAHARAALDISDGLAADFGHLCRASGVDGVIEADRIPLSPAARRLVEADPAHRSAILGGGDDYEILFTASPDSAGALAAAARSVDIDITPIGRIGPGGGNAVFLDPGGVPLTIARPGWTHG
jgi:thiamine-monophosphate kinase